MDTRTAYEIKLLVLAELDLVPRSKEAAKFQGLRTLSFESEEEARSNLSVIRKFVRNGRIGKLYLPDDPSKSYEENEKEYDLLLRLEKSLDYEGFIDQIYSFQKVIYEDLTF